MADRSGRAALVEVGGVRRAVQEIGADSPVQYLVTTNHYTLGDMPQLNTFEGVMGHSTQHYWAIKACIQEDLPNVSAETFRRVLTREYPDGCFCPYYQYWLGTLRAMILDLTAGQAEVCFGAPGYNEWRSFTLEGAPGVFTYPALFPQKG